MTDGRGRRLPFDRASVGVGDYWYGVPDPEAVAYGFVVLYDRFHPEGPGPFAGHYERKLVGRANAINNTVEGLLNAIFTGRKATFAAHKVMPPLRVFARGSERQVLARKTLSHDDTSGILLRCDAERCVVDHFDSGFADAANEVVAALGADGWSELGARKPHGLMGPSR